LRKIRYLESYTYRKFIEADPEIKQRMTDHIKEQVEAETRRFIKEYENDHQLLMSKLRELQGTYEKRLETLIVERDQALKAVQEMIEVQKKKDEEDFSWKETILAGIVGYRYGKIGAVIGAVLVNLIPNNLFDESFGNLENSKSQVIKYFS